ncbi:hypothetical protein Nepgr_008774 [Nepenthes gracilis]|uniref:Myb-related protein 123 n=1 Tax=Nepenthes gracilis TaxID=150966 RepID=A0AAD3S9Q8_NEPGR|nr:hypothetical protein Nepgr_008774 [Nepenthes gracilis]
MGRSPCCSKEGLNRGAWTAVEDKMLAAYISGHGEGNWRSLPRRAGLKRCGKSCRLRWLNYLRPGIKRGNISNDEEDLIIRLHNLLGNRWSLIAGRLPGRTDNEIKNYWNTTLVKKIRAQRSCPPFKHKTMSKARVTTSALEQQATQPPGQAQATTNPCQTIQTQASRCTKVIVDAPPPPPQNLKQSIELTKLANTHSSSNVPNCSGKQNQLINSCNLTTNYVHFEEFNDPTLESWMESSFLGKNINLDMDSLTLLLEEWA